jgi:DNA mismatch endonuclease Vsr
MADTFTPAERSEIMRRVRGSDTSPERALRRLLWSAGLVGYRTCRPDLPGKPDVVYGRKRVAIFLDGCFWHGCPSCYRRPSSNRTYWDAKVRRNRERDRKRSAELRRLGWRVLRIWEHEARRSPDKCVTRVRQALRRSYGVA